MPMDEEEVYTGIDGNQVKSPVAICRFYKHRGYLTVNMIKVHGCLKKNCSRLQRLDCQYWEDRKKKKQNAKDARRKRAERKL